MRHFRPVALLASLVLLSSAVLTRPAQAATTSIVITPPATTVVAGHTAIFIVKTNDGSDVTSAATLSSNDPRGSLSGATYTAGEAGRWTIQAVYQSFTASATVTVTPGEVADIQINPNSDPELVTIGKTQQFTAQAYDANRNAVSGQTFTWTVIGTLGSIDQTGKFTASSIGTGKVQAQVGLVTGQVSVETQSAPVTNVNTSTNANTNSTSKSNAVKASTNKNTNSPQTTNGNTNSATTENANVQATNLNTNSPAATTGTTKCTSLQPWIWNLILVVFLIAVAVLYGFVPVTKIWPVIVALAAAGILAYVQRKYDCHLQTWWAWVVTLGTLALSALAIRSKPMSSPTPKQ